VNAAALDAKRAPKGLGEQLASMHQAAKAHQVNQHLASAICHLSPSVYFWTAAIILSPASLLGTLLHSFRARRQTPAAQGGAAQNLDSPPVRFAMQAEEMDEAHAHGGPVLRVEELPGSCCSSPAVERYYVTAQAEEMEEAHAHGEAPSKAEDLQKSAADWVDKVLSPAINSQACPCWIKSRS